MCTFLPISGAAFLCHPISLSLPLSFRLGPFMRIALHTHAALLSPLSLSETQRTMSLLPEIWEITKSYEREKICVCLFRAV